MLKVYGIHGRTSALIRIPAGNRGTAFLECEFARGRMGLGLADSPATYTTRDPIKQSIIENSPMFGSTIKLLRAYLEDSDKVTAPATRKRATAVPEVDSYEKAVTYLKENGAKAVDLKDEESVKSCMKKMGVTFPNYKF